MRKMPDIIAAICAIIRQDRASANALIPRTLTISSVFLRPKRVRPKLGRKNHLSFQEHDDEE